jgi:hypothetical protein
MVTFRVDDVTPAAEALPTRPLSDLTPDAMASGHAPQVIEPNGVHPLLHAIGQAFADHRPLVLSPDAVWLTITQGLAQHVRLHARELRPRLVKHAGRERVSVDHLGPMPHDPDSWRAFVDQFSKQLAAEAKGTDLFECDFSTSTDVERIAARVVMLDAYSPYFALWMQFICGIPSITLTGTVADWRKIRDRVDALPGFGLETWHRSLVPITDQFVSAAQGDVDTAFWQRIYSPVDAYGGRVVTGWATRFYPYLKDAGGLTRPNSLLELPIDEPRDVAPDEDGFYRGPGVRTAAVPATLSRVLVHINDQVKRVNRVVALHAGLVGVAQDGNGSLRPVAGWRLTRAEVDIDDVVDRIERDHITTPPTSAEWLDTLRMVRPADVSALYHRIGSASLFDGAWRVRPVAEHSRVRRGYPLSSIYQMIDLADGRCVAALVDYGDEQFHWLICRIDDNRLVDEPSEIRVYGTSLAMLLDAALDSGGDIAHLETGRLDQLDRAGHDE